jgi:hypothetical protein
MFRDGIFQQVPKTFCPEALDLVVKGGEVVRMGPGPVLEPQFGRL